MADGDDFGALELEDGLDADGDGATSIWNGADSTKASPFQAKAAAVAASGSGKSQGVSKSASHGRAASSSKEKKVKCDVCLKSFAAVQMAVNSPYCLEHKRAIDRLSQMSRNQKQEDWWRTVRGGSDRSRLAKVVLRFCEQCPPQHGKRNPFHLGTLVSWYESKVAVKVTARGTMMTWPAYLAFAKSAAGGGFSEKEAEQKWRAWMADEDVLRDMKGEGGEGTGLVRLRIPTQDDVDLTSEYARGFRQELHTKEIKKPDDEGIEKQRRLMFAMQGSAHDADVSGVGAGMLANLAGATSMAAASQVLASVSVADVTRLGDAEAVDDEDGGRKGKGTGTGGKQKKGGRTHGDNDLDDVEDQDDDDEDEQGDHEDDEDGPETIKAKPWDAELGIGRARRKANDTLEKLRQQVLACAQTSKAATVRLATMSADAAEQFAHERSALAHRLQFVEAVLSDDSAILARLVTEVQSGSTASPCGTSDGDKVFGTELISLVSVGEHISSKFTRDIIISAASVRQSFNSFNQVYLVV